MESAFTPLTSLSPASPQRWQSEPYLFEHNLHLDPRFTRDSVARLIERYPRDQYSIIHMGQQGLGGKKIWREGDVAGLSGKQVLLAIESGLLWLNLRNSHVVASELDDVLPRIFAEAGALTALFPTQGHRMGILASSPGAQVYYHADLPGQGLLQLHGRKRIYLYPPRPPYITGLGLENIALTQLEVGLHYDPDFDASAQVFDLEPGQGLFWPLNAPHRVENHDCLNISLTLEYDTADTRRLHIINLANGILRHHFGYAPRTRKLSGPSFYAKAVLQKLWRDTGRLKSLRSKVRPIEFRLDPDVPGRIIDLVTTAEAAERSA